MRMAVSWKRTYEVSARHCIASPCWYQKFHTGIFQYRTFYSKYCSVLANARQHRACHSKRIGQQGAGTLSRSRDAQNLEQILVVAYAVSVPGIAQHLRRTIRPRAEPGVTPLQGFPISIAGDTAIAPAPRRNQREFLQKCTGNAGACD